MNEDEIKEYYGLTDKQYVFANYYLKGDNPSEAYRKAYNTKANVNSVSSQAGRVLKNPRVAAYIRDMQRSAMEQARAENRDIMETVDVLEWLSKVVKSDSRSVRIGDRLKAADMLLKAGGAYIQKIEADVHSINDIVINIVEEDDEE